MRYGTTTAAMGLMLGLGSGAAAEEAVDRWPLAARDRPLTLPAGMYSVGVSAEVGGLGGDQTLGLGLGGLWGASYGFTDALSVGVAYGISLEPSSDGKGPLALAAGYTIYAEGPLIVTPTLGYAYDLAAESDTASAGLAYWYNFAGILTLYDAGQQISVSPMDGTGTITIPVALGFQVVDPLFVGLSTTLIDIALGDDGQYAFFGADAIPLGISAAWSPIDALDIGVSLGLDDLLDASAEALALGAWLTYYGGE